MVRILFFKTEPRRIATPRPEASRAAARPPPLFSARSSLPPRRLLPAVLLRAPPPSPRLTGCLGRPRPDVMGDDANRASSSQNGARPVAATSSRSTRLRSPRARGAHTCVRARRRPRASRVSRARSSSGAPPPKMKPGPHRRRSAKAPWGAASRRPRGATRPSSPQGARVLSRARPAAAGSSVASSAAQGAR